MNNNNLDKSSGMSLIAGSVLMVFTMVLHPVGGGFEHLIKISSLIIITHSVAIVAIPLSLYGFWGLTNRLGTSVFLSILPFVIISFGLIAVMCAAATNGLALPLFINKFEGSSAQVIESIRPIISYNTSLNHAFDFIYIGATCTAILLWSLAILKTKIFPKWIGWLGIFLTVVAVVMLISGYVFVNLHGFRVFISGLVCWIFIVGYSLFKGG